MRCGGRARVAWAAVFWASIAQGATLRDLFTTKLGPLPDTFGTAVARSVPTLTASTALSYEYDPETGSFTRVGSVLGQLFLERATPLGAGHWSLNLSYQYVRIDSFDGKSVDSLQDRRPLIIDRGPPTTLLRVPRFSVNLDTHEAALSVTYGVTNDLDVNATLPVLSTALDLNVKLISINAGGGPNGQATPIPSTASGDKFGIGDFILRAKDRLAEGSWGALAAGLAVRFPTGNEDNFQSTGVFEVTPAIYLSPRAVSLSRQFELRTYANLGFDFVADKVAESEGRWGVGFDVGWMEHATLAVAVLGRHALESLSSIDTPRCLDSRPECVADLPDLFTTRHGTRSLFGIGGHRPDYYDFSLGLRAALWGDHLIGFVNVLLPLNDDGPRASAIPLGGIEATF
jgi:hypothetical protein